MSENNQNVVVVMPLKSPVIGFVLALFLGWLGVDRFYKGNVLLGIIKLIGGLIFFVCAVLALFIATYLIESGSSLGIGIALAGLIYALWYILDLILVPLGISRDNKRKLAQVNNAAFSNNQTQNSSTAETQQIKANSNENLSQNIDKSKVIEIAVIAVAVIVVLAIVLVVLFNRDKQIDNEKDIVEYSKLSGDEFWQLAANCVSKKNKKACQKLIDNGLPSVKECSEYCTMVGAIYDRYGKYQQALPYLEKACNLKDKEGCFNAGFLYHNGQGVKQDFAKAKKYYEKTCDMEDKAACNHLGFLYAEGQGVKQDEARAKKYFGKACDLGNQNACDNYKILNEQGVK